MAQQVKNPAGIHEDAGSIPGLTRWVARILRRCGCGVGHRCGWDPALLWLWRKPVAAALIRPLAWELPYASGAALKEKRKEKKRKKRYFPV